MLRKKLDYEKKKIRKRHVQIGEVLAQVETPYRNFNDSSKIFTHFETFSKGTVRNHRRRATQIFI